MKEPVIQSLLDTDLYKYTMQQSMVRRYPSAEEKMAFYSRAATPVSVPLMALQRGEVEASGELRLQSDELLWLSKLPFITD